jgi:CBS domain-containing protein
MLLREMPVRELMVTDVLTFTPDITVADGMRLLVERDVDAGPVIDEDEKVVGLFSTGDVVGGPALPHDRELPRGERGVALARQGARRRSPRPSGSTSATS